MKVFSLSNILISFFLECRKVEGRIQFKWQCFLLYIFVYYILPYSFVHYKIDIVDLEMYSLNSYNQVHHSPDVCTSSVDILSFKIYFSTLPMLYSSNTNPFNNSEIASMSIAEYCEWDMFLEILAWCLYRRILTFSMSTSWKRSSWGNSCKMRKHI